MRKNQKYSVIKVGLTGGIASGKSTIAKMFKTLGAEIIDADKIARQVVEKGMPAYRRVVKTFGIECLNKKGEINRPHLGKIVFSDPEKRKTLNAIVHPEVFKMQKKEERTIRGGNSDAVIIFDVPLLMETGSHLSMDKVVLVQVDKDVQVNRLMTRNHLSKKESLTRIRAQMPFYKKKKLADYVIDGGSARTEIRKRVKTIYDEIKKTALKNR